ncbi:hypothetical protein L293_2592 [Acinetobacter gyllenbergii CIP 110306 = MTCC 11365]|nr:hypothetical protein L293_2592 [Acinetobacter gyllenbergii CIP 110306 = MTCC 11365]
MKNIHPSAAMMSTPIAIMMILRGWIFLAFVFGMAAGQK